MERRILIAKEPSLWQEPCPLNPKFPMTRSVECYRVASRLDDGSKGALACFNMGSIHIRAGHTPLAHSSFASAVRRDPDQQNPQQELHFSFWGRFLVCACGGGTPSLLSPHSKPHRKSQIPEPRTPDPDDSIP